MYGVRLFALASFLATLFVLFTIIYFNEISHTRPIRSLVSRSRSGLEGRSDTLSLKISQPFAARIFNDDRPNVRPKPFLQDAWKKIGSVVKRGFVVPWAQDDPAGKTRSKEANSRKVSLSTERAPESEGNDLLEDDVENRKNDIFDPERILRLSKKSRDPDSFILSHLKTFLSHLYSMGSYTSDFTDTYEVPYGVEQPDHPFTRDELLCELKKNVRFRHIDVDTPPFSDADLGDVLPPSVSLDTLHHFRSCAVVSSSGALAGTRNGAEIDDHDAVFRFNDAPTWGFESVVGSATTFRLLNSQLLSRRWHKIAMDPMFTKSNSTLIVWDPSKYRVNLEGWFRQPDHPFFEDYLSFRDKLPNVPFYIVHPAWIWRQWDFLQRHAIDSNRWSFGNPTEKIFPNPPTTGFMGITLALELCDNVTAYEFVPSIHYSEQCHYWNTHDINRFCTVGTWHPVVWEKRLMTKLHHGTEEELYIKGKLKLKGFAKAQCPPKIPHAGAASLGIVGTLH